MGDIILFTENNVKKKYQNVKNINTRIDFKNIKIKVNQNCLNFKIKKEITDQELKIIYKELANMLTEMNPAFYKDIIPLYMNYITNYCCINKIPITKQVYIKELDILRYYLETRWNYKIEKSIITEEQAKLTEIMQRR